MAAPPTKVVLTFNEPIGSNGTQVQVNAPSGTNVAVGDVQVIDNTVTQPVGAMIEAGRYQVDARVVSADGHPIAITGILHRHPRRSPRHRHRRSADRTAVRQLEHGHDRRHVPGDAGRGRAGRRHRPPPPGLPMSEGAAGPGRQQGARPGPAPSVRLGSSAGWVVAAGMVATGIVVMVVALLAAGGAPKPLPAGLLGAGMSLSWSVPVLRFLADAAAMATGGALVAVVLFLPATNGRLGAQGVAGLPGRRDRRGDLGGGEHRRADHHGRGDPRHPARASRRARIHSGRAHSGQGPRGCRRTHGDPGRRAQRMPDVCAARASPSYSRWLPSPGRC